MSAKIKILPNGPILVSGDFELTGPDGVGRWARLRKTLDDGLGDAVHEAERFAVAVVGGPEAQELLDARGSSGRPGRCGSSRG